MKIKKRLLSLLLAILIISMSITITIPVNAFPGNYWWYPNNMHVRIYHPASGKYLGIGPNGNEQNGARLQLQDKQEGNQLQIFFLKHIANDNEGHRYYQIRVHGENNKIIEVRNNSKDDWGEVAQWDEHTNESAIWSFFTENLHNGGDSPICCIKNYNSKKLLNVAGGEHYSGNNIIQYHEDGTSSETFQIINIENDVADWKNVNTTYKTVNLEFNDINSWQKQIELAARNVTFGGHQVYNPSGNSYYNGNIITGITVLERKSIKVKMPLQGPGNPYKWETIDFPSKIQFKLHRHDTNVKMFFTVSNLKFWQQCECGYRDEWIWEVPWLDTSDAQTTQSVIKTIKPVWKVLYNVNY